MHKLANNLEQIQSEASFKEFYMQNNFRHHNLICQQMMYQLENNYNDKATKNVKTGSIDITSESAVSYLLTYPLNLNL